MKNELIITLGAREAERIVPGPGPQAPRLQVLKRATSPFIQLVMARSKRTVRIALPAGTRAPLRAADRSRIAALRAAEMAAWEASGGDAWRDLAA